MPSSRRRHKQLTIWPSEYTGKHIYHQQEKQTKNKNKLKLGTYNL